MGASASAGAPKHEKANVSEPDELNEMIFMDPQPYTIDDQADANDYLTDLLQHLGNRSTDVIERHCALRVKDPAIKEYFLATGAKMLAGLKNTP